MKYVLQFILNIILFICFSIVDFFMMLWYGKLPKISIYHRVNSDLGGDPSWKEIFNDKYFQSIQNPVLKGTDILDLIYNITKNCDELQDNIEIKDKNGNVIDKESLYSYLHSKFIDEMDNKTEVRNGYFLYNS